MEDYEEKRMQAIKKEENSRTEMMIQRMRYIFDVVKILILYNTHFVQY